jgi:predicted lipoprotein with Yx(FWY)xxD motif
MKSLYSLSAAAAAGAALLISGCSSSGSAPSAGGGGGGGGATTVAVRHVAGGQVLVDDAGRTLYLSDQEKGAGKVLCTSSACQAIWTPLTVPKGEDLSAPSAVAKQLTVVTRPDGTRQVAFGGTPLYLFSFDHAAGDVKGDGQKDSFDGTDFTWHAATARGTVSGPPAGGASYPYGRY